MAVQFGGRDVLLNGAPLNSGPINGWNANESVRFVRQLDDIITVSDFGVRIEWSPIYSDPLKPTDDLQSTVIPGGGGGGTTYTKSSDDPIATMSDGLLSWLIVLRSQDDTISAVIDGLVATRLAYALIDDLITTVTDGIVAGRIVGATVNDFIALVTDALVYGRVLNPSSDDFIALVDNLVSTVNRFGLSSDGIALVDEVISSTQGSGTVNTATLSDAIVLSDGTLSWALLTRSQDDVVPVLSDDTPNYRLLFRFVDDTGTILADGIISTVAGGAIFTMTQTDTLLTSDGLQSWRMIGSTLDDPIATVSDGSVKTLLLMRSSDDTLAPTDGFVPMMMLVRIVDDAIVTLDDFISLYLPALTASVSIRLSAEQSVSLGAENFVRLGFEVAAQVGADSPLALGIITDQNNLGVQQ